MYYYTIYVLIYSYTQFVKPKCSSGTHLDVMPLFMIAAVLAQTMRTSKGTSAA